MNLLGKKVLLKPLEKDDMEILHFMINDPDMSNMVVGWSKPISMVEQERWFENLKNDLNIRYAISYNGKTVGSAIIHDIDWKNKSVTLSIKVLKDYCKIGIGKDTIKTLIEYCFNELNVNRICAEVLDYNISSNSLFKSCGFVLEGTKRNAIYKKGKYNSLNLYSILKEEYNEGNR